MKSSMAATQIDGYKIGHPVQYPKGMTELYLNLTARSGANQNVPIEGVVFVGLQHLILDYLVDEWNRTFFQRPKGKAVAAYKRRVSNHQGQEINTDHIADLHDLGFLPIEIKALPEGSLVPYGVPSLTVRSTHHKFAWLPGMLEDVLSNGLWLATTSATTYTAFRRLMIKYAEETGGDVGFVKYQAHDFSFRGMGSRHAGAISGFGALAAGAVGTDCLPAIDLAEDFYGADSDTEVVGVGLPASEHSVTCAGGADNEWVTYNRWLTEVYPTGPVSIVADSWDFWGFVDNYLPAAKAIIMSRNGKLVVRPDSGDPVDVICGNVNAEFGSSEYKGLIESLWDIFGGTVNTLGFRNLDSHIGAIYGDSITYDRAERILQRLKDKGFASDNIVFGLGSFTYQYVTRDTHSFAVKATHAIIDGAYTPIFKSPKTGSYKKSAKGYLMVTQTGGKYALVDQVDKHQEKHGCLETVFKDGVLVKRTTLAEIRERTANNRRNLSK